MYIATLCDWSMEPTVKMHLVFRSCGLRNPKLKDIACYLLRWARASGPAIVGAQAKISRKIVSLLGT